MPTVILRPENARERMAAAWRRACEYLELGRSVRLDLRECKSTRSLEQNAMLHSICRDISQQRQWAGKWLDTEAWKRLLVDAWARVDVRRQIEIVPSLDGQSVVNLGLQTRKMSVGDMADLITFAQAWACENGVRLHEARYTDEQEAA